MNGLPYPASWHAAPGHSPSTMDHLMRLRRRLVLYVGIETTLTAAHAPPWLISAKTSALPAAQRG